MSEWETVFEYEDGGRTICGTRSVEGDEIHVYYAIKVSGDIRCGTMATVHSEDAMNRFFYNHLRDHLGSSWLIMRTLIEKTAQPYLKKMKKIEQQILPATVAKYREILGPLKDINKKKLDEAAAQLKIICESWQHEDSPHD